MSKVTSSTNWPLLRLIQRHRLTYTELAHLLQVSPASVHNLLYGSHAPSFSLMYKFLVIFQLSDHEMMEIFFINENDQEYLPHIAESLQAFEQQPPYGKEKTYLLS